MVVDRYFERHPAGAGSKLEREARAKLLIVHASVCPLLGEGRREQLRLVLRAFALHPRRTLEELGRLVRPTVKGDVRAAAAPCRKRVALFLLRVALTVPRTGPVVVADEVGYLTNARLLAGGVWPSDVDRALLSRRLPRSCSHPLLAVDGNPADELSPRARPEHRFLPHRSPPLVYLLLTPCFSVRPRAAVWPSLAAAAYPSVTIYTQVAMSENLLLPLFVLWLLCSGASSCRREPRGAGLRFGAGNLRRAPCGCGLRMDEWSSRVALTAALRFLVLVAIALAGGSSRRSVGARNRPPSASSACTS